MIVSHAHKFVFVHLKRTSGRAIQSALMPFLGPDDIATPIRATSDDGKMPASPGRNCEGLGRHSTARQIRARIGVATWNEYFTFTLERNPWDKILSRYWNSIASDKLYNTLYMKLKGQRMSLEHWLKVRRMKGRLFGKKNYSLPRHHECYTDDDGLMMVDFIGRFENREAHLAEISRRIGLPIDSGVKVGTRTRQQRSRPHTEVFDKPWMRALIEELFAPDLELLGYRLGEPFPMDWVERPSPATLEAFQAT